MFSPKYDRNRGLVKSIPIQDVVQYDSSTPAVERCVVSVGGTVWVDKLRVIYYSRQTPKLSSSRLQSLTWKHAFTILHQPHTVEKSRSCTTNTPTCPLKNYVILVLMRKTRTSLSKCSLKTISVSSRSNVIYEYFLSDQSQN